MKITKKKIAEETYVTRLKGFKPRFKYFYQNKRYQFSVHTGQELEVWRKGHNKKYPDYPGTYFTISPTSKKDFVDFVYWYLIDNQN